jgi:hypothetical protein
MAAYFKEQFKMVFPRKGIRHTITTLFTLNITDVENLLGYLGRFQLSDIFESYHTRNRTMLTSLSSSEVPILKGVDPERNILRERFAEFGKKIEQDLFPQEAAQQNAAPEAV